MKVSIVLAVLALSAAFGAAVTWSHWRSSGNVVDNPPAEESAADSGIVTIASDKLSSLALRVDLAARHPMQEIHVVPGRIQYDDIRHAEIRTAANGILVEVNVMPGDRVSKGDVLAVVSSPEIGTARADVHHAHEDWKLACKKRDWEREVAQNASGLIDGLQSRVAMTDLERRFKGKTLGKSREVLMSAYSRYLVAKKFAESAESTGTSVLAGVTIEQRKAERRSAEEALKAGCEQVDFDVKYRMGEAEIAAGDVLRRMHIAQAQLTTLLGYSPDTVPMETTDGEVLSRVEIRAPFAGTIEQRRFSRSERVRTSDAIFVLADTTILWVAADIREQDWKALAIAPGQELSVDSPALAGRRLKAHVKFVGREVTPETNSVPLVAEISNADGVLRPGLFVHVSIPIGPIKSVLCVPAAAVVQHERTKFLFVQESPTRFRRVNVQTGMENDQLVEIVRGIGEKTPVVVQGATVLKAELLLEKEAEE